MNIDDLTLGQIKSLGALFTPQADNSAGEIGANYLIRTVTMIDTGRLVAVTAHLRAGPEQLRDVANVFGGAVASAALRAGHIEY